MPARAQIAVGGQPSTALTLDRLKGALLEESGRLINEAADLGEDGYYRHALKRESKAQAYLDVLTYICDGTWPKEGENEPEGNSPSEDLADRFEELRESIEEA